jgi:acetyl esterase/lipase
MRTASFCLGFAAFLLCRYAPAQTAIDTAYTPPGYEDGAIRGTIHMPRFPIGIGVVLVPGTGMTRSLLSPWCDTLAAHGYTAMAIDYSPTVREDLGIYPKPVRAVKTAVQFLRRNAAQFNIATGKIIGMGFSAGAIFWGESIIWDNDFQFFRTDSAVSDRVDAAVLFYGLYDTQHFLERQDQYNNDVLLNSYFSNDTTIRATKGNCIVNIANITTPVLLIHGTSDANVSYKQSVQLNDSLIGQGKSSQLVLGPWVHAFDLSGLSTGGGRVAKDTTLLYLGRTVPRDVAYVNGIHVVAITARKQQDTVLVWASVENPQHHPMAIIALLIDNVNGISDSVTLFNDGLHQDGLANDSIWGGWYVPSREGIISVGLRVGDLEAGTVSNLANLALLATAGPVRYETCSVQKGLDTIMIPGAMVNLRIGLRNMGATGVITNVTGRIAPINSADFVTIPFLDWPTLYPGDTVYYSTRATELDFDAGWALGDTALFSIDISSNGVKFWHDTMRFALTGVVEGVGAEEDVLPTSFALQQNYPNPFNPSTTIKYELPKSSVVRLSVFDMLGREVSVLVNERRDAGVHEVKCDGSNLASGVYFYRLQAGDFVSTKKMLTLK